MSQSAHATPRALGAAPLIVHVPVAWLDWDPVRMAPRYADALRSLRAVWAGCRHSRRGSLDLGAQASRDQLCAVGLPDARVHFELFDAGHRGIDDRYPLALAWLCHRITDGIP